MAYKFYLLVCVKDQRRRLFLPWSQLGTRPWKPTSVCAFYAGGGGGRSHCHCICFRNNRQWEQDSRCDLCFVHEFFYPLTFLPLACRYIRKVLNKNYLLALPRSMQFRDRFVALEHAYVGPCACISRAFILYCLLENTLLFVAMMIHYYLLLDRQNKCLIQALIAHHNSSQYKKQKTQVKYKNLTPFRCGKKMWAWLRQKI